MILMFDSVKVPKEVQNYDVFKLAEWLSANMPAPMIAQKCAELIKEEQARAVKPPITITQDEFDRIFSLFKIRGLRDVDGETVKETRGRKRKSDE